MRHTIWIAAVLCAAAFIVPRDTAAENWPNWRGPTGDGVSLETNLPADWSAEKNILWRRELPGAAGATPIVWEDRIFLTAGLPDKEAVALLCLDLNGEILWQKSFADENWSRGGANAASPSPVTDGKHVWAFASNGDLACYDFKGDEVWALDLEERYGRIQVGFTFASSPVLDGDKLYLQLIHARDSLVVALDKSDGAEIWRHKRATDARGESKQSYASSFLWKEPGNESLIVHGADYATGHALKDGEELWRLGGLNPQSNYNSGFRFVASPVARDGIVVIPTAKNGSTFGLKGPLKANVYSKTTGLQWKVGTTTDVPSPLIYDGLVYICRINGFLICVDGETGEELYNVEAARGDYRSSPVYADGKVFLISRRGIVTAVKAGRVYEPAGFSDMGETTSASMAVSNGRLYIRTYKALYAIGEN